MNRCFVEVLTGAVGPGMAQKALRKIGVPKSDLLRSA
jgi:hypothetical protein